MEKLKHEKGGPFKSPPNILFILFLNDMEHPDLIPFFNTDEIMSGTKI